METPLHTCNVHTTRAIINRIFMLFQLLPILCLLYYRFSLLFSSDLVWTLATLSDLLLAIDWALNQPFRWRPVTRSVVGPEAIPDEDLPRLDVLICTADPVKEPVVEVMNTVISALALDYPPEKLAVYLSDDGGAPVTREAIREAWKFSKVWLPFCTKYGIKTRCPQAFFSSFSDGKRLDWNQEFKAHESDIKSKYEAFKRSVEKASEDKNKCRVINDRSPCIEVMNDKKPGMPLLVYVSREKRPAYPHRFKAGALNALLRVSGLFSNGPYVLVLDCDMYCNDPTSARQAMCFHMDPELASSLAFVQYPQIFYNASKNDIYDGQARSAYKTLWQGMDGIRGPLLGGTAFYLKRKALYGHSHKQEFKSSPSENSQQNGNLAMDDELVQKAMTLATCTYESKTQWGHEIGFSYECLLESTFTSYMLHSKGWKSVYLYPKTPSFLGCTTIDMKDAVVQLMKWSSGLLGVGLSKYCPLIYGISRMPFLQAMCYAYFTFFPVYSAAIFIYGIAIPICLLKGIPVFPKVSDPWMGIFVVVFMSSLLRHLYEVLSGGDSLMTWWNEVRIWIFKAVTACLFGMLEAIIKKIGVQKASFRLTNKVTDKEKLEKYKKGKFDFQGAAMLMAPLILIVMLNLVAFIGGVRRMMFYKNYEEMAAQLFLSFLLLVLSYPIFEGMVTKAWKS